MEEFNKILDSNEKIFWEGKPKFWPFFTSSFILSLFGLPFLIFGAFPLLAAWKSGNYALFVFPHFWIGLALVFGAPLYALLAYKHVDYAITNKRVLIQSGLIGRDFKSVDFDQITNAEVNVGVLDTLVGNGSGSINISTAGTFITTKNGVRARPYQLTSIQNPYQVFQFFKKVSHDVKTDISFPNKYRPNTNPGYSSTYQPKIGKLK